MSLDRPAVLVVDDRPDNLLAVEALLADLPCRVETVTSGEEALKRVLHDEFALMLLDVQMPGLDGYETARHLKMREQSRRLPIIFLSAIDTETRHLLRGYGTGAVDFIPKPVIPEVLTSKVRVFLDLYTQSRQIEEQRSALAHQVDDLHQARAQLASQADELSRSNAALERFAHAVSHDVSEPLQLASGFLSLLSERYSPDSEEAQLMIERSRESLRRAVTRLEGVLEYSVVSTAQLQLGPVDLKSVFLGVESTLAPELAQAGASLTADPLPVVTGDEWQLVSLLTELVHNALEHGGPEPDVHIGVSRRKSRWVVTVHDSGPGADVKAMTAALDMVHGFTRGMGLGRCRRIVERHGETIWVETAAGVGTSVSFTLTPAEL